MLQQKYLNLKLQQASFSFDTCQLLLTPPILLSVDQVHPST